MVDVTFIIFGFSGDLAKRSLIGALYNLFAQKKINNFVVIGTSFDDISVELVLDRAKEFIKNLDQNIWLEFCKKIFYQKLNFNHVEDFFKLREKIKIVEKEFSLSSSRLFYCATESKYFKIITQNLAETKIISKQEETKNIGWNRIAYEKPFGYNLVSAKRIYKELKILLDEKQVWCIDHYLTKELVNNIIYLRFTNRIIEELWSNKDVEEISIVLNEKLSVNGRGKYYDSSGALVDIIQNHLFQVMALIGMDLPEGFSADKIHECKIKAMKKFKFVDGILGQYDGYKLEKDVDPDSKTETYAALKFLINNKRWQNVPFILKTGKCLDKSQTYIEIKFKSVDCKLTNICPTRSNSLIIRMAPEPTFILNVNIKEPEKNLIDSVDLEFCYDCKYPLTPSPYAKIFENIISGERSISVRFDEIEISWKLIDKIRKLNLPIKLYEKFSSGPQEAESY